MHTYAFLAGDGLEPGTPGTLSGSLRVARLAKELKAINSEGGEFVPSCADEMDAILQATAPGKRCAWCGLAPRLGMSGHG